MKTLIFTLLAFIAIVQFGCESSSDEESSNTSSTVYSASNSSQFSSDNDNFTSSSGALISSSSSIENEISSKSSSLIESISSSIMSSSSSQSETSSNSSSSSLESISSSVISSSSEASSSSTSAVISIIDNIGSFPMLEREGNLLFVGNYQGILRIYDVSAISSATLLSTFDTGDIIEDIAYFQNALYIANNQNGLSVIDINDPSHPVLAKQVAAGYGRSIEISDGNIYMASGYQGICIIDLATLSACNSIDVEGDYTDSIALFDGVAYTSDSFLDYVVMSNTLTKEKIGELAKDAAFYSPREDMSIARQRKLLFISDNATLQLYSLASSTLLTTIESQENEQFYHSTLSLDEETLYVTTKTNTIGVYSISTLESITREKTIHLDLYWNTRDSVLSSDGIFLYVATDTRGVAIVSLK